MKVSTILSYTTFLLVLVFSTTLFCRRCTIRQTGHAKNSDHGYSEHDCQTSAPNQN